MSTRSRGFAKERRKMTLPAKIPVAKPTAARNLRFIVRLLSTWSLRLWRVGLGVPEAALEVVEDEPDRRSRPGRRGDPPRAVADDEDAAIRRRRLELRDRALGAEPARALEQLRRGPRDALGGLLAPERRAEHGTVFAEEHRRLDLGRDLGQIGEGLSCIHGQARLTRANCARAPAQ